MEVKLSKTYKCILVPKCMLLPKCPLLPSCKRFCPFLIIWIRFNGSFKN